MTSHLRFTALVLTLVFCAAGSVDVDVSIKFNWGPHNDDDNVCCHHHKCNDRGDDHMEFSDRMKWRDCRHRCEDDRHCHTFETRKMIADSGEPIQLFTLRNTEHKDCHFPPGPFFPQPWSRVKTTEACHHTPQPVVPSATAAKPTGPMVTTTTTKNYTDPLSLPSNVAFTVALNSPFGQPGGTIPFISTGVDKNNHYQLSTNSFSVTDNGIYYIEICSAVPAGQTASMRVAGSAPITVGVTWDATIQNGVETQCRGALTHPGTGATLSVVLDSGALYSDSNFLTSFTVFNVQSSMTKDAISRTVFAVGALNPPMAQNGTLSPIPMIAVIAPSDPSVFNAQTATYTCKTTGNYFVSASVGAPAHASTGVQITNNALPIGLTRSSLLYDGVTTLSRTTILPCTAGSTIQLNLLYGTVVNWDGKNSYNLTTFTVIPYEPANVLTPVAWAAYKWYISFSSPPSSFDDPFYFSNITVNQGNPIQDTNNVQITVPVSGYYYVQLSSGTGLGNPQAGGYKTYVLALMRGSQVLFSVEHLSSSLDASDVFWHGGIVLLNKGDVIRAVGAAQSYYYSSLSGYETSFIGMLLYTI